MALPSSGAISINAINVELGRAGTTPASLNEAALRTLAGVASGAISMSNFHGKANLVYASGNLIGTQTGNSGGYVGEYTWQWDLPYPIIPVRVGVTAGMHTQTYHRQTVKFWVPSIGQWVTMGTSYHSHAGLVWEEFTNAGFWNNKYMATKAQVYVNESDQGGVWWGLDGFYISEWYK